MGKYFIKIGKISAKIHEIGKIKAIFGLGMTPIYGPKNGQIKSLYTAQQNKGCTKFQQQKNGLTGLGKLNKSIDVAFVLLVKIMAINVIAYLIVYQSKLLVKTSLGATGSLVSISYIDRPNSY